MLNPYRIYSRPQSLYPKGRGAEFVEKARQQCLWALLVWKTRPGFPGLPSQWGTSGRLASFLTNRQGPWPAGFRVETGQALPQAVAPANAGGTPGLNLEFESRI
jgi:hypothetical protein